jgi:hypothetical protein
VVDWTRPGTYEIRVGRVDVRIMRVLEDVIG